MSPIAVWEIYCQSNLLTPLTCDTSSSELLSEDCHFGSSPLFLSLLTFLGLSAQGIEPVGRFPPPLSWPNSLWSGRGIGWGGGCAGALQLKAGQMPWRTRDYKADSSTY